jgi:hypothetical protein
MPIVDQLFKMEYASARWGFLGGGSVNRAQTAFLLSVGERIALCEFARKSLFQASGRGAD